MTKIAYKKYQPSEDENPSYVNMSDGNGVERAGGYHENTH